MALKTIQEQGLHITYFPSFAHPLSDYDSDPPDLAVTNLSSLYIWCLTVMFALSCTFHKNLLNSIQDNCSFAEVFILLLCINEKPPSPKRKRQVAELLQSNACDGNTDVVDDLDQLLSSIPIAKRVTVDERGSNI